MRDLLPDAGIGIAIAGNQFLNEVADIVRETGSHRATRFGPEQLLGNDILSLHPLFVSLHSGLHGQLIYTPKMGNRIRVEVRADAWIGGGPSYETYVQAIHDIFSSLIHEYNSRYGTRYRLTVASRDQYEPRLPPSAKVAFDRFLGGANRAGLHQSDWDRYYAFAKICHRYGAKIGSEDVMRLLVKEGFSEEYAWELAITYNHLRDFQRHH